MWEANPTWGSPKIVAELAMLGVYVAKSTVEKYKPKRTGSPSPKWRTFLDQHVRDLVSIDFFIVPTATFRVLFVFIVRKRLANYIFPYFFRVAMMLPSYINREGMHHETKLIEKRDQSPALA